MNFTLIKNPNLPQKRLVHCLVGKNNTDEIKELSELGVKCITLNPKLDLDAEISNHADIYAFNCGDGKILIATDFTRKAGENCELPSELFSFSAVSSNIRSPYPEDVALNAALLQNKLFCNTKYVAPEILSYAKVKAISVIHTNQGYSRCSMCIVSENAVITEDCGLAKLLKKYQIDVLTVRQGDVKLSEKHSGFLGGASAKLSKDIIYFGGNLKEHRDYTEIAAFLNKHHVKPVFNTNRTLTDFGGIIQLTECI